MVETVENDPQYCEKCDWLLGFVDGGGALQAVSRTEQPVEARVSAPIGCRNPDCENFSGTPDPVDEKPPGLDDL